MTKIGEKKEYQPDNSSTDSFSIVLVVSVIGIEGTISMSPTCKKGKERVEERFIK